MGLKLGEQPANSIWSPEMIVKLARLWDEGHSTAEIGRRLHISKNATLSKVHRLHLTPRPSPLGKGYVAPRGRGSRGGRPPKHTKPRQLDTVAWTPRRQSANGCRWPIEDEARRISFCGKETVNGTIYCADHEHHHQQEDGLRPHLPPRPKITTGSGVV